MQPKIAKIIRAMNTANSFGENAPITKKKSLQRLARWLGIAVIVTATAGSALAQTVSLIISNDPALKVPSYLTTDGTNLILSGVGTNNTQHIFSVPLSGGAATTLYSAYNPQQITLAGSNIFWIDPNAGPIGDTEILAAPANGSGSVTTIYIGSNVGQPIVDGSGMASDGIFLYAADEVAGTVWRMKLDGSSLTQLGPPRYTGGFGAEHLNTIAVSVGVYEVSWRWPHHERRVGLGWDFIPHAGIAVGNGSIYISDAAAGNTIWQLPLAGGTPTVLVSGGVFKQIQGLCYLNGNLYVSDTTAGAIYRITLTQPAFQAATYLGVGGADLAATGIKCLSGGAFITGNNSVVGSFMARYNTPMSAGAATAFNFNWPGSSPSDNFNGVTASASGVYAAAANFTRTVDSVGGKEDKGLVAKFPLNGATGGGFGGDIWDRQTPGAPGEFSYGGGEALNAITLAVENGTNAVYATGSGQHDGGNGGRFYIAKLAEDSTVLWTADDGAEMIGESYSVGRGVVGLHTNVYAAGLLTSAAVPQQAYLRKYNSTGGLVWSRADNYASGYNGVTAIGNSIYAVGWSGTNSGQGAAIDFLIEKWDENGNQIWARSYDRSGAEDCLNGVVSLGGRLFVTGYTRGQTAGGADAALMEIDPATGAALSLATYGGAQDDFGIGVDTDGTDLYVVGQTRSFGNGSNDVMVLRYSLTASLQSIGVTPVNPTIGAGTNLQFTATGHFSDGSSQALTNANWLSGTPGAASINPTNGLARGLSLGSSLITASSGGLSNSTLLTVVVHPTISTNPMSVTAAPGGNATLTVSAAGGSLSYQWQLNGTNIAGATSSSLTVSNLNPAESGAYTVIVSNAAGNSVSTAAELSLLSLNMYAGLTIVGQVGATYEIDYMNSLSNTNWNVLTNLVLPSSPYIYFDTSSPFSPSRFYRALKQ